MKRKRKNRKNRKLTERTKTILLVVDLFILLGNAVAFKFLGRFSLVGLYLIAVGRVISFPAMKDLYDEYKNGEVSENYLVTFLGHCAVGIIYIVFCIFLTIDLIQGDFEIEL